MRYKEYRMSIYALFISPQLQTSHKETKFSHKNNRHVIDRETKQVSQ